LENALAKLTEGIAVFDSLVLLSTSDKNTKKPPGETEGLKDNKSGMPPLTWSTKYSVCFCNHGGMPQLRLSPKMESDIPVRTIPQQLDDIYFWIYSRFRKGILSSR
jgi:hypothetical protein